MAVTRINNNQISDASAGNVYLGVNAAVKLQNYSVTATKLANNITYGSDLTITGNLTIQGNTTTVDTTYTTIEDPTILLASNQTGSPSVDIGFVGERGTANNIAFVWDESASEFVTVYTSSAESNTTIAITSYADFHTANANIGGNLLVNGNASIVGTVLGNVSLAGNITMGNILTGGLISATGNVISGNVNTGGRVSATGNIISSGNVSGGNILGTTIYGNVNATTVSASGNITGGNVLFGSGIVSGTGNITGGNVFFGSGIVSGTGNISGNYFLGNGSQLTGVIATTSGFPVSAGTSNVAAPVANGNITVTVAGTSVTSFANTGVTVTGVVTANGNITGGNFLTGGLISATGNLSAGNLNVTGNIVDTGALTIITGSNGNIALTPGGTGIVTASGNLSAAGNVTGGNILTGGAVLATGNVSATANVLGGNLVATTAVVTPTVIGTTVTVSSTGGLITLSPSSNVSVSSKNINNLAQPVQDNDAASKIYVDNMVSTQLSYHAAVVAATTGTLETATGGTIAYVEVNGAGNGIGAKLTTTGSFNLIDTANIQTANTRVLVKNQANGALNGIYSWANATSLVRTTDADTFGASSADHLSLNDYFFVASGNVNAGSAWIVDSPTGTITFGTSNIQFAQFSSSQTYSANTQAGILFTGTVISAKVDNNTTAFDGGGNIIVKASANLTTPNIGAATGTSLSVSGNVTGGNVIATTIYGNVNATTVSASGNTTAGNLLTAGLISAASHIGSVVSVTGNITGGNVIAATHFGNLSGTTVSASGNITGGNVLFGSGIVSGTGNITGGNVLFGSGIVSGTGNITGGNLITSGQLVSTLAGNSTTGAGQIFLNGAGNNRIDWAAVGTGAPAFTTRSAGTKVALYPAISGSTVDYAIGIDAATMWYSVPENGDSFKFKWYGATTEVANLSGIGTFAVAGNITGANIRTAGLISATGNITSSGNITGGNVLFGSGIVSGTGNITGANVNTGGTGGLTLSGANINSNAARITINSADSDVDFAIDGDTLANVFYVDAGTGTASFGSSTQTTNSIVAFNASNSILFPVGNTAQRPGTGVTGMIRFNSTLNAVEVYDNSTWASVGTPVFTVISDQQFTGDGTTVAFTLSAAATTNSVIVSINGIVQIPTSAYSVSSTTLTFTEAPQTGDLIDVRNITTTTSVTSISNSPGNAVIAVSPTINEVSVTGNLVPVSNATQSLGSPTSNWKSLYVAGNTIYLGGLQLTASGSTFTVYQSDGTTPAAANTTINTTNNITVGGILNAGANGVGNIGNSTNYFNTVHAKATSAQYADLAEIYAADATYEPGTVLSFGGTKEVTLSSFASDARIAGVVSTNPSYVMNATLESEYTATVALTGRVPTFVSGPVAKGDMMVSGGNGRAVACATPVIGTVIGKALENHAGGDGVIEVVVGRL